jgi:hypothetical protein
MWLCDDTQNIIRSKEVGYPFNCFMCCEKYAYLASPQVMPGIPPAYEAEEREGRALFVIVSTKLVVC